MTSLLEMTDNEQAELDMFSKLLLTAGQPEGVSGEAPAAAYKKVVPKPGFCVKTKTDQNEKIFINVCQSDNVPEAVEISEDDLLTLLESEDPSGWRIPMSIGEAHTEVDKSGSGCTVYDVVIHHKFYSKIQKSSLFHKFFLTVMLEGLETKYTVTLSREWIILKNRKFMGSLSEQNIRKTSKPLIMEVGSEEDNCGTQLDRKAPLITELSSHQQDTEQDKPKGAEPVYQIIQEPSVGHPEFLVAEIHLPKVKTVASVTLDVGEDRILLQTRSSVYYLDIFLPYNLEQDECGAQFNRNTKILSLTLPVQPAS